jgi:CBS domain-containing protein
MIHSSWAEIRERIARTEDVSTLRAIREQVHETYRDPLLFADFVQFHFELNAIHDALIARTIELAVRETNEDDLQPPALAYAFVLFGSGGRREQTLWSDQDNGLVYEDPKDDGEAEQAAVYFERLAANIHEGLYAVGYPPCSGGVLAGNPMWRKPYGAFADMVKGWMDEPDWENIRYLLIFSDIRCIYGMAELVDRLRLFYLDYVHSHPAVLQAMLHNTLHHKVSMGMFGHLITERYGEDAGGVDIKYGAYIPIVNGIRLLAVQAGIEAASTLDRIAELHRRGAIPGDLAKEWTETAAIALKLRAMAPFQLEDGLYTTRGKLPADRITKDRKLELKRCLRAGQKLQKYVKQAVRGDDR